MDGDAFFNVRDAPYRGFVPDHEHRIDGGDRPQGAEIGRVVFDAFFTDELVDRHHLGVHADHCAVMGCHGCVIVQCFGAAGAGHMLFDDTCIGRHVFLHVIGQKKRIKPV
jgi:hypothetical protein